MKDQQMVIESDSRVVACRKVAALIQQKSLEIQRILSSYSPYPAVKDEIDRSIYLMSNIDEGSIGQKGIVNSSAAYGPRNQLLYALIYLGVAPSLVSDHHCYRPPHDGGGKVLELHNLLSLNDLAPSLNIIRCAHIEFTRNYASNSGGVFFTGKYENAIKVMRELNEKTPMFFSGAGHNPIIVFEGADVERVCATIINTCFINQGQDCSAPNAIFVERSMRDKILLKLKEMCHAVVNHMQLGRHPENPIGKNTDKNHLYETFGRFERLRDYLVFGGCINPASGIIYPTIFCKKLSLGAELDEFFAPVIMLQDFDDYSQLFSSIFLQRRYQKKAMYVTFFIGKHRQNSEDFHAFLDRISEIHPPETVLINYGLLEHEKGTLPYGGYGEEASFIRANGQSNPSPILPHRDLASYGVKHCQDRRRVEVFDVALYDGHELPTFMCKDCHATCNMGLRITIFGRIQSVRLGGRFFDLHDETGMLQVGWVSGKMVQTAKMLKKGDKVRCTGVLTRTSKGYMTLEPESICLCVLDEGEDYNQ